MSIPDQSFEKIKNKYKKQRKLIIIIAAIVIVGILLPLAVILGKSVYSSISSRIHLKNLYKLSPLIGYWEIKNAPLNTWTFDCKGKLTTFAGLPNVYTYEFLSDNAIVIYSGDKSTGHIYFFEVTGENLILYNQYEHMEFIQFH